MNRTPSRAEFHVLLTLAEGQRYGYEICRRADQDSDGAVRLHAGSLYRILARLMEGGWLDEAAGVDDEPHPGVPRRYYVLTAEGRSVLAEESARLRRVLEVAEARAAFGAGPGR